MEGEVVEFWGEGDLCCEGGVEVGEEDADGICLWVDAVCFCEEFEVVAELLGQESWWCEVCVQGAEELGGGSIGGPGTEDVAGSAVPSGGEDGVCGVGAGVGVSEVVDLGLEDQSGQAGMPPARLVGGGELPGEQPVLAALDALEGVDALEVDEVLRRRRPRLRLRF